MLQAQLIEKLESKQSIIGIIGLGYVGLPLMLRYAEMGYRVLGVDVDEAKVARLNNGESCLPHIDNDYYWSICKNQFEATTDFNRLCEADAMIICVPTPLTKCREPDLRYVEQTIDNCLPILRKGQVISLESTTYPGTTDELIHSKISASGLVVGEDIFLVYSPEREDPANPNFVTATIPKVVGGYSEACLNVGVALYEAVIDKLVPVSSTRTAEMTKLLENIHRAVNIGLVNEMKLVCDKMGIDIHEVVHAAATKPFGFVPYYPGPGIGGHCIPIDPFYLTWKAREYGIHTRFIELAGEVNSYMPYWVVNKIIQVLNEHEKPLKNSRVLLLGMAYKKNVGDMRESPSLTIFNALLQRGAAVDYSDPHVPSFSSEGKQYQSVPLTAESLASFDCVVLTTAHLAFDYELIKEHAALIVDTRGVYHQEQSAHIVKA